MSEMSDVREFNNLLYGLQQAAENGNEAQYEQKRAELQRILKAFLPFAADSDIEVVTPGVLSWDDWQRYKKAIENGARREGFEPPLSATYSFCFIDQEDGQKRMLDAKGAADLYKAALRFADA